MTNYIKGNMKEGIIMKNVTNIKEASIMKKMIIILFFAVLSVVLIQGTADAKVAGECVNCHTMHASQGGTNNANWSLTDSGDAAPRVRLLANTCQGCHTTTGSDPYGAFGDSNVPYVKGASLAAGNHLAGGYFTSGGGGHDDNSHTLTSTVTPAGYTGSWYEGTTNGLTCAGTSGCHGDRSESDEYTAISGGHHETSSAFTGAYRFLFVGSDATEGVQGTEAADYEEALISTTTLSGNTTNIYRAGSANNTVSELCGQCHTSFHGDIGSTGAWSRHPVDQEIPATWQIIADSGNEYDDDDARYNPIGFLDGTKSFATGKPMVMCLSCHRAHGSQYDDNLRFDYTTQDANTTVAANEKFGCLGCHSLQR